MEKVRCDVGRRWGCHGVGWECEKKGKGGLKCFSAGARVKGWDEVVVAAGGLVVV